MTGPALLFSDILHDSSFHLNLPNHVVVVFSHFIYSTPAKEPQLRFLFILSLTEQCISSVTKLPFLK
jgi:hypothetical protein